MTPHDCPYCSGTGHVGHADDVLGLGEQADCPLCDGSGIAASATPSARGLGRLLRRAVHQRQALFVAVGLVCGGIILLALQLLAPA